MLSIDVYIVVQYCQCLITIHVVAMLRQRSEEFSLATNPSGKPDEGRGRCPYNPYNKNTAITVGKTLPSV